MRLHVLLCYIWQLDTSVTGLCLCLVVVSVFLRVNFVLKISAMVLTISAHLSFFVNSLSSGEQRYKLCLLNSVCLWFSAKNVAIAVLASNHMCNF
jgi:hypothetical protein